MAAKKTETSAFGVSGRVGHDSRKFYAGKLYREEAPAAAASGAEQAIDAAQLDQIFCQSSENMQQLPDHSVHLMVTSPPYNVGKTYDEDLSLADYRALLRRVWEEVYRVLVVGGRACINIANLGRKPYIPLNGFIAQDMAEAGFLMRGEIIWDKGASAGASCAWGSWRSASNPVLRDTHEYILIFCKESFARPKPQGRESTIGRDEFLEFTKSVWCFSAESAKKVGHAAPFPPELPHRLIQLYTYAGEVVLDPFMGSGTTALAARSAERHFVGYEISKDYVNLCNQRTGTLL